MPNGKDSKMVKVICGMPDCDEILEARSWSRMRLYENGWHVYDPMALASYQGKRFEGKPLLCPGCSRSVDDWMKTKELI